MAEKNKNGQVPEVEHDEKTEQGGRERRAREEYARAQSAGMHPSAAEHRADEEPGADADAGEEHQALDAVQLAEELERVRDQLLRQAAEYQNYRRRTEQERLLLMERGKSMVLLPMLDVLDDLRRSLEASEQVEQQDEAGPAYQALKEGVELVYQKFVDELSKLGVEPIEAVGKPFNENEHEAMMQQPAPEDVEPGTVIEELQRGYRLGDRVLRHARVIVAA